MPAVLLIHGGRVPSNLQTTPKDWQAFVSFGQLLAASGFVGITFNHRFYTWDSLYDSQTDVSDAVEYVRSHATSFGVDPNRVVLWTVSAGSIFLSQPLREHPSYLRCLVAYYPEVNLEAARAVAPPSVTDQTLKEFSPVLYLTEDAKLPPMFVARAGLDDPDSNVQVGLFLKLALERNLTIEVMNHPGGHHGFDVEDNNARSREIIKRTIEFIREHTQK